MTEQQQRFNVFTLLSFLNVELNIVDCRLRAASRSLRETVSLTETFWLTLIVISYVPSSALDATIASCGFSDWWDRILHVHGIKQCLSFEGFILLNSPLLSRVIEFFCVFYGTFSFGPCCFKIIYTSWIFKMMLSYTCQTLQPLHILILDSFQ